MSQSGYAYQPYPTYGNGNLKPTDRFYVRNSVYLPNAEVDPQTGMLRKDAVRRGRTQAMRMEARQLDHDFDGMNAAVSARRSEKGMRISRRLGVVLIAGFLVLFSLILLLQQGTLSRKVRLIALMNQHIETLRDENADLQSQIDEASDPATICYAAARDLDMIPANATQAIHLTAVDTRPSQSAASISASAGQTATETEGE